MLFNVLWNAILSKCLMLIIKDSSPQQEIRTSALDTSRYTSGLLPLFCSLSNQVGWSSHLIKARLIISTWWCVSPFSLSMIYPTKQQGSSRRWWWREGTTRSSIASRHMLLFFILFRALLPLCAQHLSSLEPVFFSLACCVLLLNW